MQMERLEKLVQEGDREAQESLRVGKIRKGLLLDLFKDWNWRHVFRYANGREGYPTAVAGQETLVSTKIFGRKNVAEIYRYQYGENDGKNWTCAGRLFDGRYFYVTAGCDYTGWG